MSGCSSSESFHYKDRTCKGWLKPGLDSDTARGGEVEGGAGSDCVGWSCHAGQQAAAMCTHGGNQPGRSHDCRVDPQDSVSTISLPSVSQQEEQTNTTEPAKSSSMKAASMC